VVDYRSGGTRIEPILVFLALPLPKSPNSIWLKFTAVVGNAAPGRTPRGVARHGTARYGTAPSPPPAPSLLFSWRNTRSILLRPILVCIFGMCSPRRKSAATVRTVWVVWNGYFRRSFRKNLGLFWLCFCFVVSQKLTHDKMAGIEPEFLNF
jgi:hypothetical protein